MCQRVNRMKKYAIKIERGARRAVEFFYQLRMTSRFGFLLARSSSLLREIDSLKRGGQHVCCYARDCFIFGLEACYT